MLHLIMVTLTSLLPSSGLGKGVIDRPIQRDQATALPTIYGSSVKGAIKSYLIRKGDRERVERVLGGEEGGETIPSKVSIGDALLTALPVPSRDRFIVWLVPKINLLRMLSYIRDLRLCERDLEYEVNNKFNLYTIGGPDPKDSDPNDEKTNVMDSVIPLKELEDSKLKKATSILVDSLDKTFGEMFEEYNMILLENKYVRHFIEKGLGKRARIKIDYETGTVESGKLWYEEYYPPYTVFFVPVLPTRTCEHRNLPERDVCELFRDLSGKTVPFGGSLTVGMGFTKVYMLGDMLDLI